MASSDPYRVSGDGFWHRGTISVAIRRRGVRRVQPTRPPNTTRPTKGTNRRSWAPVVAHIKLAIGHHQHLRQRTVEAHHSCSGDVKELHRSNDVSVTHLAGTVHAVSNQDQLLPHPLKPKIERHRTS